MAKATQPPKIFVALDVDQQKSALKFAAQLQQDGIGFKIGPRLINRYGSKITEKIAKFGPVFIDQKFFDIPSTMVSAIQAAFDSGASFATIHALSGPKAMAEIAALEKALNRTRPFKVLAVTILTSFDEKSLPFGLRGQNLNQIVEGLTKEVITSGLSGIVCSPFEIEVVRKLSSKLMIVTPGIRAADAVADDQSRTMDAATAFEKGSTSLVIGRPIIGSKDPLGALTQYLA